MYSLKAHCNLTYIKYPPRLGLKKMYKTITKPKAVCYIYSYTIHDIMIFHEAYSTFPFQSNMYFFIDITDIFSRQFDFKTYPYKLIYELEYRI